MDHDGERECEELGVALATIALTLGAAGGVLAGLSFVQAVEPQVHWGDVSAWFGAIGTVSAFVAGVVVIRRDNRWRRRDEARRQDELRKQQAEFITGWWDSDTSEFELINNSKSLAYRVLVVLDHQLKPGHRDIELGLNAELKAEFHMVAALPPGTKRVPLRSAYADSEVVSRQTSIRFNDAAGHHWLRGNLGELIETDEDPLDYLAQLRSKLEEQAKVLEQKAQQILSELGDGESD